MVQAGESGQIFLEGTPFWTGKPNSKQLDLGMFAVLICLLKRQTHFLHFRDFQMFVLHFSKLPESSEG